MIGMMYLVLIAMLALNVSSEILNGFKLVDDSLHTSTLSINEQNDRLGRGLHFVNHLPQPILKLALHAGSGLQQTDIQHPQRDILQGRRHIAGGDPLGKTFDHGGLANPGLASQDRVILTTAH